MKMAAVWARIIARMDRFPRRVAVNFDRRTEVQTSFGVLTTVLVYSVILAYAMRKGQILINRENPDVSLFTNEGAFSPEQSLELEKVGLNLAFTVIDYKTQQILDDPAMVHWVVQLQTYMDLEMTASVNLRTHKCNETDMS